ncbi:hypothetical protein WN55_11239 [Dufourea novaeangliae]|uniref:Uncharacterized protein n=1 Tax=Dufourea novaeangliae TaxID=178035 RepID=A0A154PB86_DUFNO|nr:hypothetical protein WN55_11239 [Dufourea novaeangliae]
MADRTIGTGTFTVVNGSKELLPWIARERKGQINLHKSLNQSGSTQFPLLEGE